jgi:hypothetical protein
VAPSPKKHWREELADKEVRALGEQQRQSELVAAEQSAEEEWNRERALEVVGRLSKEQRRDFSLWEAAGRGEEEEVPRVYWECRERLGRGVGGGGGTERKPNKDD